MNTPRPDLYATLGVPPTATPAQIKSAYRALLRRHHPDIRAPEDESQHTESVATLGAILTAYAILRDPVRRAAYDRQTSPLTQQVRPQPQTEPNTRRSRRQPPIVASPVRWHRTP